MRITVKIYADLREYTDGEGTISLGFAEKTRIRDITRYLKIPEKTIKIIMLNGRRAGPDAVVHDGDRVALFPPIAGG
ncbi:MoaD/ThiS family protein [archaeon]|nr:MoaD/ThiS family protein [archaeon]